MTYNTRNPLGSTDPRDLFDNAQNFDKALNELVMYWIDRLGVQRLTEYGRNQLFNQLMVYFKEKGEEAITAIGWQELGDWSVGLQITNRNQIVSYDGSWYKFLGELPHTIAGDSPENDGGVWSSSNTAGVWANIGDAALRSNLGSSEHGLGASLSALEQGGTVQDAIWYKTPEMFGAVGDGVTDDSGTIQNALNWLSSASYRHLVFNPGKKYRTAYGLNLVFGSGVIGCRLHMRSPMYPDESVINGLMIYGAICCEFHLCVLGNGAENLTSIPDYSQEDPDGCRQAFVVDNSRNNEILIWGFGYTGRVLKTQSTGDIKTSNNFIRLRTGDSSTSTQTGRCGQACYLQGGSDAFGSIGQSRTAWDIYGSVLDRIADVAISEWEADGGDFGPAMTFTRVASGHIGKLSLGSNNTAHPVFLFQDYGTTSPASKVHIDRVFTVNGLTGIKILGTTEDNTYRVPLHITSAFSYNNETGIEFNNISNVEVDNLVTDATSKWGILLDGTLRNIRVNGGFLQNPGVSAIKTAATADFANCFFKLRARNFTSGTSLIDLSEGVVGAVTFDKCYLTSAAGNVMNLPSGNSVIIDGGNLSGASGVFASNRASMINGTSSPVVAARGSSNFSSGSANGATITISHGLGLTPTDIDLRWVGLPPAGAQLILTTTTSTSFTVTLSTSTALTAQVNFRWFANAHLA